MILAKAPLRVSLFGGGSDIPAYYSRSAGSTISMAIDKYVYVAVMHTPHDHIKVTYSKMELVNDASELQNEIIREALKYFAIKKNIEITTFADIPTIGTGLGGSSAFTCALVAALGGYLNFNFGPYDIAEIACYIEINMCGWNIGKQDQYASAFGGMNYINYSCTEDCYGEVLEDKITVTTLDPGDLAHYCLLIPTNMTRHSSDIIDSIDFEEKREVLDKIAATAYSLRNSSPAINEYSKYLNQTWENKRKLSPNISNDEIDIMYGVCLDHGASACKLLGAGGGGFMLALTTNRDTLKKVFPDRVCLDFNISRNGAQIVYRD